MWGPGTKEPLFSLTLGFHSLWEYTSIQSAGKGQEHRMGVGSGSQGRCLSPWLSRDTYRVYMLSTVWNSGGCPSWENKPTGKCKLFSLDQGNWIWWTFGSFSHPWALRREFMVGSISDHVFVCFWYIFPHWADEATTWMSSAFKPKQRWSLCYFNFVTVSFWWDALGSP